METTLITDGYRIEKELADPLFKTLYRKRTPFSPIPNVNLSDYMDATADIEDQLAPQGYEKMLTSEPIWRPVPHIVKLNDKLSRCLHLYEQHITTFWSYISSKINFSEQTVERRSRVGAPYYSFFRDEDEKRNLVMDMVDRLDFYMAANHPTVTATILNVRLQPEIRSKKRIYQFINEYDQHVEIKTEPEVFRSIEEYPGYLSSRVRLVFNYHCLNLRNQLVDSTLHDAYLTYRGFHHDMTAFPYDTLNNKEFQSEEEDISHYERILGALVLPRAKRIGGTYQEITELLMSHPFVVKSTDSRILVIRKQPHQLLQLGSGLSCVATLGKEFNAILFSAAYASVVGVPFIKALDAVLNHTDPDLIIAQFGDDSKVIYRMNNRGVDLKTKIRQFRAEFIDAELEDPPKFLGYKKLNVKQETINRLSCQSAYLNFFLNERQPGSAFRPYPSYGYFLRRLAYKTYGEPDISSYLSRELDLLDRHQWLDPMRRHAIREKSRVNMTSFPVNFVLGKEYLLTKDEKIRLNLGTVIPKEYVSKVYNETSLNRIHQVKNF